MNHFDKIVHCMEILGPKWQLRIGVEARHDEDTGATNPDDLFAYASLYLLCPDDGWSDKDMVDSNGYPRHEADRTLDRVVVSTSSDASNTKALMRNTVSMLEDQIRRTWTGR